MPAVRRFSLPFKDLIGTEIELGAWHCRASSGDFLTVGDEIAGWDYVKSLEFRRDVVIDGAQVAASCDLPLDAGVVLVVTAHSPAARFRRVVFRSSSLPRSRKVVEANFALANSYELSRELRLDTEVLLSKVGSSQKALVANLVGSRLFGDTIRISLEGGGARMPVEMADLGCQIPGLTAPDAPWHVLLETSDMHAPVMQSLRVFLNSRDTPVARAARDGDVRVLSLLKADVARRLLLVALQDDEFLANPDLYAEGSTGEAARRLLRVCFKDLSPQLVQTFASSEPARFESVIQSAMSLPDG